MHTGRYTHAEIDLLAIRRNMLNIKALLAPGVRFCAVVKANGYGHGAVQVARQAAQAGANYLAVAVLGEAIELRRAGFTLPILILGHTPPEQYSDVAAFGITQTIFTLEQAQAISKAAQAANAKVKVHIKVDTGMGRLGLTPDQAAALAEQTARLSNVELEGVFTHFAKADTCDKTYAHTQFTAFKSALEAIEGRGVHIPIRHCANSAATLDMPETHLDMVRTGIIQYGLWPSDETGHPIELVPAMRLKTRIAQVKTVPAGSCISYGCTYTAKQLMRVATLPLGYADGWPRILSNRGVTVINGRRAPVLGRICMDQCMVDVTQVPEAAPGSEVLLFGGPELPAEEIAALAGTINYELVCMPSARVPRVYVNDNQ